MASTKVCKVCGETKDKEEFRAKTRMCKPCQDNHNKLYMTNYYEQNRKRLIQINSNAYYAKNTVRKKMGRPRIHIDPFDNEGDSVKSLSC